MIHYNSLNESSFTETKELPMKIFELVTKLKAIYDEQGDIEVMFSGPNNDQDPYLVCRAEFEEVQDDEEYPEDFDMPKGYKFVSLLN